jgi:hypothetical protein
MIISYIQHLVASSHQPRNPGIYFIFFCHLSYIKALNSQDALYCESFARDLEDDVTVGNTNCIDYSLFISHVGLCSLPCYPLIHAVRYPVP